MAGISFFRNVGAYLYSVCAMVYNSKTAGATAAVAGEIIDRLGTELHKAESGLVVVVGAGTIATNKLGQLLIEVLHSSDDGMDGAEVLCSSDQTGQGVPTTVVDGGSGAGVTGEVYAMQLAVPLAKALQYIQVRITPTMTNTTTDTLNFTASLVGGGIPDLHPQSEQTPWV